MSDKKHIDRLFQEGFKDFEAQPSDAVWKNIELKLNEKKKKRRVIPIWWRYAGAAALILLFLGLGKLFFNSNTGKDSPIPIVETEPSAEPNTKTNTKPPLKHNESIVFENNEQNTNEKSYYPPKVSAPQKTSSSVANTNHKSNNQTKTATTAPSNNSNFAQTNPNGASSLPSEEKHGAQITSNKTKHSEAIAYSNQEEDTKAQKNLPTLDQEANKNGTSSPLEENNTKIAKNNEQNENSPTPIEDALKKNKDLLEEETDSPQSKWSVATNAAPVYFNTLGEGSPIDPQLSNSPKSGEVNMSYGVSASYAINNRIKIRSGINKVNLGYNTNDIVVYQSVGLSKRSSSLQNVNSKSTSRSQYSAVSSESLTTKDLPQTLVSSNTTINQTFGFIEVPLEIQYALSNNKLGINLIGGFSSLFLDNNEIYSREENGPMVFLGEANNINKVSYSANFGLGLNYQVSKTFDLNLEPMFKYQFNTFTNTSGNFTPFFIGVYTGLSIKF